MPELEDFLDGNADWTADPWFLSVDGEDEKVFENYGFPLRLRRRAVEGLRVLYPPEVCRTIRDNPKQGLGLVLVLFQRWFFVEDVLPFLEVGLNAVDCRPDSAQIAGLRLRDSFAARAFELRIEGNLRRASYRVQRIQEDSADKRPDLRVEIGGSEYDIEIKLAHEPDLDDASERLSERLRIAVPYVSGLHLHVRGSESLHEKISAPDGLKWLHENEQEIVDAFVKGAQRLEASPVCEGVHPIGDLGVIEAVSRTGHGAVTADIVPEPSLEKQVARVFRNVTKSQAKFGLSAKGIVIVGTYRHAPVTMLEQAVRRASAKGETPGCRLVLFLDTGPENGVSM